MQELTFKIVDNRVPYGPNSGFLYAAVGHKRELYFPNAQRKDVETGIEATIPDGTCILIEGMYGHMREGIMVVPQRLYGPLTHHRVRLSVWNTAPTTLQLDPYTALASVRAVLAPPPLLWSEDLEAVDPAEPGEYDDSDVRTVEDPAVNEQTAQATT